MHIPQGPGPEGYDAKSREPRLGSLGLGQRIQFFLCMHHMCTYVSLAAHVYPVNRRQRPLLDLFAEAPFWVANAI